MGAERTERWEIGMSSNQPMFTHIEEKEYYQKSARLYGFTPGCGCCGDTEEITVDNLREHILSLKKMMREAEHIYGWMLSNPDTRGELKIDE